MFRLQLKNFPQDLETNRMHLRKLYLSRLSPLDLACVPRFPPSAMSGISPGSGGAGSSVGNSILINSAPGGGPNIKATAWYMDAGGFFQAAGLGRYSHGLGVCDPSVEYRTAQILIIKRITVAMDDFVLLEFSAPVDPSAVRVTTTSSLSSERDTDVSFWLGGTSSAQNLNLTGTNVWLGLPDSVLVRK